MILNAAIGTKGVARLCTQLRVESLFAGISTSLLSERRLRSSSLNLFENEEQSLSLKNFRLVQTSGRVNSLRKKKGKHT